MTCPNPELACEYGREEYTSKCANLLTAVGKLKFSLKNSTQTMSGSSPTSTEHSLVVLT
jgi:hypothetical protein